MSFIQKNQQMQQQLRAPIFEDKVVDHILEKVTVTEKGSQQGMSCKKPSKRWKKTANKHGRIAV